MFDLSAIDALDFLTGRVFYVPSEFADLMAKPNVAQSLDKAGQYVQEVTDTLARLNAIAGVCKECPVADPMALMMSNITLAQLKLDNGENELCFHLPVIPDSVLVTADMKAVERIQAGPSSITKVFHGRIVCFEELIFRVLEWKPYDDLKDGLYKGRWRRESLQNAFFAKGPATTEEEFRTSMGASAKKLAATYSPFLVCSWP